MKENESKKAEEQTYISKVSLEDKDFKKSLSPAAENAHDYCNQWNKIFNLSNMGHQALVSYATGIKHIALTNRSQTFFSVEQQFLVQGSLTLNIIT